MFEKDDENVEKPRRCLRWRKCQKTREVKEDENVEKKKKRNKKKKKEEV